MIQKIFVLLVVVLVVSIVMLSYGHADTIDVHLGAFSESRGVSGDLTPHFSSDPAVGASLAVGWREYVFGIETAKFIGLRSMLGTSGHTTLFANTQRKIGKYVADAQYTYIRMQSMMPSWWPLTDNNCHEMVLKMNYPKREKWHLYALAGLAAAEGSLLDTFTVVAGGGTTATFPIARRISFTTDAFVAAFLLSLSQDRKVFGKASGTFLLTLETLPLSFEAGLHAFKELGAGAKTWTAFGLQYTF